MDQIKLTKHILQHIKDRNTLHEQIPNVGKIVFNKVVPYFFLYRVNKNTKDSAINALAKSQFAYIILQYEDGSIDKLIQEIALALKEEFGTCLIIEAWLEGHGQEQDTDVAIHISQKAIQPLAQYIQKNLAIEAKDISCSIITQKQVVHTPTHNPLFKLTETKHANIFVIGIGIENNYLDSEGNILPVMQRHYRESIAKVLSRAFFEYVRLYSHENPANFKLNIHKEINESVFEIDRLLSKESLKFDFLLLVTPTNVQDAWIQFKKNKFLKLPQFQYRHMPIDPDLVKRNLYNLPIEDIFDPTIAYLFRDKRRELEEMMSMLDDRNTPDFVHGSLQVFGNVSDKLHKIAEAILTVIDCNITEGQRNKTLLNAQEFAALAEQEIAYLIQQQENLQTSVRIRSDVSGIMVNRGVLNISKDYRIHKDRAEALIQHEVGTHIATYFNGKSQPLQLFSLGVPGYEQLQEGLAVFSEYVVDGLNNERLRTLAARVVAVRHMLMGNKFIDTFSMLIDQYAFDEYNAFLITMRVYRGGGLTKDAVYLQGLIDLIDYICEGNDIKLLTVGKIRKDYLPIIKDLIQRGYMKTPLITPRYLSDQYKHRLEAIKKEGSIFKLIK